ncbi:unnamed protein product [Arctia plantaginis]|uniref:Uncharacterized protein n=1 Tax=Arctia plantaginis TaxID=874455 RepID=A0A8S0YU43_ARCPL|nr:unnamed protein product [Arctia plantaginis]
MEAPMLRNYCGIVVSRGQYIRYAESVTERVIFMPNNNIPKTRERLWFMLGRRETILICVDNGKFNYEEFEKAGLLYRIPADVGFQNTDAFSDYVYHLIYSSRERIRLCNRIRDVLTTTQRSYRWCGSENESLTNESVIKHATEINGGTILHQHIKLDGSLCGDLIRYREQPLLSKLRTDLLEIESLGQKKLYSCMAGFASPHVPIVYVGSSPGDGWIKALNLIGYSSIVVSIDPRPLSSVETPSFEVKHLSMVIHGADDFAKAVSDLTYFDFVWDVRGDATSHDFDDRMEQIRNEIAILNDIMTNPDMQHKIKRFQLKINTRNLYEYLLPQDTRLYMQPYCAFREIFEIRAVGALHGHTHLTHVTPDTTERILETVRTSSIHIPDLDLVANCLGMRLSYGDFISSDPLYNTILDIALFCINWNTPSAVTAYLDKIQTQNRLLICSFFTGRTLKEGSSASSSQDVSIEIQLLPQPLPESMDIHSVLQTLPGCSAHVSNLDLMNKTVGFMLVLTNGNSTCLGTQIADNYSESAAWNSVISRETECFDADEISDEEVELQRPSTPVIEVIRERQETSNEQSEYYTGKNGFTWSKQESSRTSRTASHNIYNKIA